jgi:hypothetical protein
MVYGLVAAAKRDGIVRRQLGRVSVEPAKYGFNKSNMRSMDGRGIALEARGVIAEAAR